MQEGFLEEGHADSSLLLPFSGRVGLLTGVAALGFSPACQLTKGARRHLQHCPQRDAHPIPKALEPGADSATLWVAAPNRPALDESQRTNF